MVMLADEAKRHEALVEQGEGIGGLGHLSMDDRHHVVGSGGVSHPAGNGARLLHRLALVAPLVGGDFPEGVRPLVENRAQASTGAQRPVCLFEHPRLFELVDAGDQLLRRQVAHAEHAQVTGEGSGGHERRQLSDQGGALEPVLARHGKDAVSVFPGDAAVDGEHQAVDFGGDLADEFHGDDDNQGPGSLRPVPGKLTLRQLNRATLERQGLVERYRGNVAEVVGRLAGLQAQHANSPYVALWSRRHDQTIDELEEALTDRSVVKATLMRATLHLVASADFPILDVASSAGPVGSWSPTAKRAGVDLVELNQALLEFCRQPRSVAEIEEHLGDAFPGKLSGPHVPSGVRNTGFRLASAAGNLVHVPPSGLWKSHGRPTYVAARVWLGRYARPDFDTALSTAVERYLAAHGPASEGDIVKWAAQRKVTAVRSAIAALGDRVVRYTGPDGRDLVDLADSSVPDGDLAVPSRFLSRWDSVLIAYDVRDRILPAEYKEAVIKKNGDFLPTFLVDGFVGGLWAVEARKGQAVLTMTPFARVPRAQRQELEEEAERLVRYVEAEADTFAVAWSP